MTASRQDGEIPTQAAAGKKILITGGTSGVGLETARQLVAVGADVTVVGSGMSKGKAAERSLNSGIGLGHATFVAADLSSLAAVRQLAAMINERFDRLDVLINNAGVVSTKRIETVDGNERTFTVNYLAPFLLTNELLPLLKRSEPARILALTAAVEPFARFRWDDLQRVRRYGGLGAYAQSKRALATYTIELARRLRAQDSGVTANVVDPFLVQTTFTSADDVPLLFKLARPLMIQPQTAARWISSAAVDARFAATTGRHIMFGHRAPSPPASRSQRTASRLWETSAAATELTATHQATPPGENGRTSESQLSRRPF